MHRSEEESLSICADCGGSIDPARERGFGVGSELSLCWDCALRRGGSYDASHDCWEREPRVDDLAEPPR